MVDASTLFARQVRLTKTLLGLLWVLVIADAIGVLSGSAQHMLLLDVQQGVESYDLSAAATRNDNRQQIVGLVQIAVLIVTIISAAIWIRRANVIARQFGAEGMTFSPNWSIGWYFIPIANLFKPFQAIAEIWRASGGIPDWKEEPLPWDFSFWWGFWLISNFAGQAAFRLTVRAEGVPELLTATKVSIASDVLDIISSLAFMSVVKAIASRQRSRLSLLPHDPQSLNQSDA